MARNGAPGHRGNPVCSRRAPAGGNASPQGRLQGLPRTRRRAGGGSRRRRGRGLTSHGPPRCAPSSRGARQPRLPWNVCRTEVYSGTALRDRLEAEGRLEGDYRSYGYRMRDSRAEVLFRIVRVSLHERALAIESLLNRLISLSFARQLDERYFLVPTPKRSRGASSKSGSRHAVTRYASSVRPWRSSSTET
jgi:hypothetical protein